MNAHTPGPWWTDDTCGGLAIENKDGNVGLVNLARASKADAKLIAAAPDLLRELLQVRDAIIGPSIDRTARDRLVTVGQRMELGLDRINTALAKAGL